MKLFGTHKPGTMIDDSALIVRRCDGVAIRLWHWWSNRYEVSWDAYLNRNRRVWLFIQWRPIRVRLYFV